MGIFLANQEIVIFILEIRVPVPVDCHSTAISQCIRFVSSRFLVDSCLLVLRREQQAQTVRRFRALIRLLPQKFNFQLPLEFMSKKVWLLNYGLKILSFQGRSSRQRLIWDGDGYSRCEKWI